VLIVVKLVLLLNENKPSKPLLQLFRSNRRSHTGLFVMTAVPKAERFENRLNRARCLRMRARHAVILYVHLMNVHSVTASIVMRCDQKQCHWHQAVVPQATAVHELFLHSY
jgi:hypothetical protein